MTTHETFIRRCIQLAYNGLGNTYPNPLVGCVIVYNDKIIGEGWHQKAGENHAEINAIESVKDKELLKNSTLYVNLEPCSHFGKTPPCDSAIIQHKIPEVIVGTQDIHSKVNGIGILHLQQAGIEIKTGILEEECKQLNKRFFTFHQKKRPYIILKFAQTVDGFLDKIRNVVNHNEAASTAISNGFSSQLVHKWRSEENAILVGTNTVIKDNPKLNIRHWKGNEPYKIIIDKELKINNNYAIFNQEKVIIFNAIKEINNENIDYVQIDFSKEILPQLVEKLYEKNIQSVVVEGGKNVLEQFIRLNLWDEARIITALNKRFHSGIEAPKISGKVINTLSILDDYIEWISNV